MKTARVAALLAGAAWLAPGGGSTAWEINTYADFVKGRLTGLSLTREGQLRLAPRLDTVLNTDQTAVWCVAAAPDGTLYAGTGHRGRLYRVDASGRSSVLWTAPAPEIFAAAVDARGRVYAATSPNGKIYRLEADGQATEFYDPKDAYIWALAFAPDGTLYAGGGGTGRIHRIDASGKGQVFYETGQNHVTALAVDAAGNLLAGTEPNGLLYRIDKSGRGFVLYDSSLPEIRSVVIGQGGTLYAAALGGGLAQKAAAAAASQSTAGAGSSPVVTSSITVTADAQSGINLPPRADAAKPATDASAAASVSAYEMAGVEKAALYRIAADNTVETLWSSKEENVYDVVLGPAGTLLFSTDQRGRVYRLETDLKATLLAETREGEATRLLDSAQGTLAATSNLGRIYRLAAPRVAQGSYESLVHDAGGVARWGRLEWRGDFPAGSVVRFRTRSGNSQRPDRTWSEWSAPITSMTNSSVASPNARFIQWMVEMEAPAGSAGPGLDSVAVSYLPQNNRPAVRSITVIPQWGASSGGKAAAAPATQTAGTASYSITVTESGDAAQPTSAGTPSQSVQRQGGQQLLLSWQADDADGDRLQYTLWFKGEDEQEWKRIKDQLAENTYLLDADLLADGRYLFRVEASDSPSNTVSTARTGELVSPPVIVDNTPPRVTLSAPRISGGNVEIDVLAEDASSPLRRVEFSADAGAWLPLEAQDGITDSRSERYLVRLNLPAGEHVVVVRAFDSSLNPGLAKTVVRVPRN